MDAPELKHPRSGKILPTEVYADPGRRGWHFREKMPDSVARFVRADLARPKVKALVWGPFINDFITVRSIVGKYEIERDEGHFYLTVGGNITEHLSEEAAKAAAQADYERRILAALEE